MLTNDIFNAQFPNENRHFELKNDVTIDFVNCCIILSNLFRLMPSIFNY